MCSNGFFIVEIGVDRPGNSPDELADIFHFTCFSYRVAERNAGRMPGNFLLEPLRSHLLEGLEMGCKAVRRMVLAFLIWSESLEERIC